MRCAVVLFTLLFFIAPLRAQDDDPAPPAPVPQGDRGEEGIGYGLRVSGRLDNATPRAAYVFDGLRGEVVSVTLRTTSGDLDPVMAILNNSGELIASLDDSAGGRDVRLDSFRIPQSDRYYVIVGRFGYGLGTTAGEYELALERIGVSPESGSALRYGDTIINRISDVTPQLYYSFRARRGDIVNVVMRRISGNLDTYLQVVNSRALVIADNDDVPGSGSLDAEISGLLVEEDGTYVIIASRFGQAAGDSEGGFYLSLQTAEGSGLGNSRQAALPINPGVPVEGELTQERFAQYYQFSALANDVISVHMERLEGGVDSYLTLLDANGVELAANDDIEGSQNAAIENFLIPANGIYTIMATRFQGREGRTAGRYRLTLEEGENISAVIPENVQFIPYGSTLTGRLDDATPQIMYAFFGQAGEVVTVSMTRGDGDLDPVVSILNTAQQSLASNDDSDGTQNARIDRFTLPATGVYYLQAARYSGGEGKPNTSGSYILVLAQRFD